MELVGENPNFLKELRMDINSRIDIQKEISDEELKQLIMKAVFEKSLQRYIALDEKRNIINSIFNSMRRLDILQPLIEDDSVTEIMVNGADNIFIEKEGKIIKLDTRFDSAERLEDVIQFIVSRVNRTVNESSPIVDARLEDGSRVNVVLSPIALNGPVMTIRKFPSKPMTMGQLVKCRTFTEEASCALHRLVQAKYNIFISGGTSSGKTTLLNALSSCIPKGERVITIEDSAELQITGVENIVRLETRNANTEGKGQITIRDLIRTSLRMRPERIIVGEVRGPEALDMLQAMNTGHDGSISTGHANSTADMLSRLETMVLSAAMLPLEVIRQQIASAIDVAIHLARLRDGSRKVMEITEIVGYRDGKMLLNPLFVFEEAGETGNKEILGQLKRTGNKMINTYKFKMAGLPAID